MNNPGLSPAVQQALQRRGTAENAQLDQTSTQAPMQTATPQPTNPSDMSKASAVPSAPQPKWQPQNQQDFVVAALVEQLKNTNQLEKEKMKMGNIAQPSMGQLPVAQTLGGMGGGESQMSEQSEGMMHEQKEMPSLEMNEHAGMGGGDLFPLPKTQPRPIFDMGYPQATLQKQNLFTLR